MSGNTKHGSLTEHIASLTDSESVCIMCFERLKLKKKPVMAIRLAGEPSTRLGEGQAVAGLNITNYWDKSLDF